MDDLKTIEDIGKMLATLMKDVSEIRHKQDVDHDALRKLQQGFIGVSASNKEAKPARFLVDPRSALEEKGDEW